MESYEKEIFNFFTVEDNFLSMCKVAKNYPSVLRQLKDEFWKIVQIKIENLLISHNSSYHSKITGKITDERTNIMLFKNDWPIENSQPVCAIAIQRLAASNWPFYGPWINRDSQNMDLDRMYSECQNSEVGRAFEKDNDNEFPFWSDLNIDFSQDEGYLKILPDRRESFAESIALKVFDLANKMEQELDEISKFSKT